MLTFQGAKQVVLVHGRNKRRLVIGVNHAKRVALADGKEVLPRLFDAQLLVFVCGTVFYEAVVFDIDVIDADVVRGQRLGDPQAIDNLLDIVHAPCAFPPGKVVL